MSVVAVIPARLASTRFPEKPLARETGKYLVQHVYERVRLCPQIDRVIVATDHPRIAEAVGSFGGEWIMTSPDHPSGTDRIAEVVRKLSVESGDGTGDGLPTGHLGPGSPSRGATGGIELVLNVQGDEPEIDPEHLSALIRRMRSDGDAPMGTLACAFPAADDPRNPNCVKLVRSVASRALYFSRSLIPCDRDAGGLADSANCLLHLGVYAYRPSFLVKFASLPVTPLERLEKLEQLRALEHGFAIAVEVVASASFGIDTPEQYARFVERSKRLDPR
ncbi:MAG: 3-deoxy-manno-octulosonate cytidylyltransferase [Phycisphaerae bacterium]|nr:3-deoxy-manno-octulosonate cytidylyltransferase [Phycisphaerae bacterium]